LIGVSCSGQERFGISVAPHMTPHSAVILPYQLPDMIFGASVSNAALLCRLQLGKNFYRLDPALEKPIPMDDPSMLDDCISPVIFLQRQPHPLICCSCHIITSVVNVAIHADLEDTIDWIREHFYGVVAKKQKKRKPKVPLPPLVFVLYG